MSEDPLEDIWPLEFLSLITEGVGKPKAYEERLEAISKILYNKKTKRATILEDLAQLVIRGMRYCSPIETQITKYYHSTRGIWIASANEMIRTNLLYVWPEITSWGINEIIKKIEVYRRGTDKWFDVQPFIAMENGVLGLNTWELKSPDPKYYLTKQIPVTYDPEASCPTITEFLSQVTGEDNIRILEEAIGYCLWPEYCYRRAFLLFGPTHTGKSTFLDLLTTFLGSDNVTSLNLDQLTKRQFGVSSLKGKFANIASELPNKLIYDTTVFKALTGGDRIDADRKYLDSSSFKNIAKIFFSCNAIPPTKYDESDAYYTRWVIIDFPNQFTKNPDEHLIHKLTTPEELSGLLNLGIRGLRRLRIRGRFELEVDSDAKKTSYYMGSDSVKAFVHAKCVITPSAWIAKRELHSNYKAFCKNLNRTPIAYNRFTQQLKKWVLNLEIGKIRERGERTPIFKGIGISGGQLSQQKL